jgi:hypothetical protein
MLLHMARFADGLAPAESWSEIAQQAPEIIRYTVAEMAKLLAGHDIFDVLELVRQHEVPITITGYKESEAEGLAAVIDVVALVALGLKTRKVPLPDGADQDQVPPTNMIIEPLCAHAREIIKLAMVLGLAVRGGNGDGSLAELAGQLRSGELTIRAKHYESVGTLLNEGVLNPPHIQTLLEGVVGFTYTDVQTVARAIRARYQEVKHAQREALMEVMRQHESGADFDPDDLEELGHIFASFVVTPGAASSFTANDIAEASGLPLARVEGILKTFSAPEVSGDSEAFVRSFVEGRNLLAGIDLIGDGEGNYLMLQGGIPVDHVRRILEAKIKTAGNAVWSRYGRSRDRFAETFASEQVSALLKVDAPTYTALKYLAPRKDRPDCDLSKTAEDPKSCAQPVEADALFVINDVAMCLEVKAGSITDKAKRGNVQRMAEDLRGTIGEATAQAQRLESLILDNRGLWLESGDWLDLSAVREVRTIVACLDDFGPLAIATDALVRANLLTGPSIPWIVSLHDLAVIAKVVTAPASFLLYLRRRTEPEAARLFMASDELDLLMWFLRGGLYFEPDPDALHARHPMAPPPTNRDRTRHRNEVPSWVGTLTDDLDAWIYYEEGKSDAAVPKPAWAGNPDIARLVAFLEEDHKPGWLRFGADLLNLSGPAQKSLIRSMKDVAKRTRRDHTFHSMVQGYVNPWGYSVLFAGGQPRRGEPVLERFRLYMTAKKRQLRADRALGILLSETSEVLAVCYDNAPYGPDEELDGIVAGMGLVPPERMTRSVVPPARKPKSKRGKTKVGANRPTPATRALDGILKQPSSRWMYMGSGENHQVYDAGQ